MSILGLGILSSFPAAATSPIPIVATPVASVPWLDRLNQWRTSSGLPVLTENATWSQGDYNHALYMVKNDLVTHYETPSVPYYTTAGDTAAQKGNIQVSSTTSTTDVTAIDWWMKAPFHAMAMMDPRLAQTGFGSYRQVKSGWDAGFTLDTIRGNSFQGGHYPVYFPGNGTTEPLTSYGGGEFPDPLQACKPYAAPTGLPVFIEIGGNVNTTAGPIHSFIGNGIALNHCIIDSSNSALHSYLYTRGGVILVPQHPLQKGVKYVVSLTVNGLAYSWSFTVGPFFGVTGVSPSMGAALGGTSVTIAGTGFTGATSVMFGTTPAASFSVLNGSTITAVSPAHAAGSVDVTVTTAMGTTTISKADQFTFACTTASLAPASGAFPAGSVIDLSASSTGCPSPLYEFWVQDPSGTWTLKQGFGGPAFSWTTTGLAPGTYVIHAWVSGQGTGHDAIGEAIVSLTGCMSASVSPPNPSQPAGSTFALLATSSGCANPQYEFWVQYPDMTWHLKQPWGLAAFSWDTTGLAPGVYTVHSWTNQIGASTATYETIGSSTVMLTGCSSAAVSPSGQSQGAGTTINMTGSGSTGCPNPQFEEWVQYPDGTWHLGRTWGPAAWSWDSSGLRPGPYTIHAWTNQIGASTATYETIGSATVTLTGCTSVPFTASSTGCTTAVYEFWVQYPDLSWHLGRTFGANIWTWTTAGLPKGMYTVHVWANNQGAATSPYETIVAATHMLT